MQRYRVGWTAVAALAFLIGGQQAQSALLVYEPFDYTVGDPLVGKSGGGSFGFDGAWRDPSDPVSGFTVAPGLNFGPLITSGGAVSRATTPSGAVEFRHHILRTTQFDQSLLPVGSALWLSYLFQAVPEEPHGAGTGIRNARLGHYRFRTADDDNQPDREVAAVVRVRTGAQEVHSVGQPSLVDGGTYLIVGRISGLGTTSQEGRLWALTESDFAAVVAAGWTEAALDANHRVSITASESGLDANTVNWLTGDALGIDLTGQHSRIDEIRLGTSLASVTPIPEPASLGLLGLGALLMFRRCRRAA